MKKLLLLIIATTIIGGAYAQKITVNKVDKFTKKHVIQTSFEKISSDRSFTGNMGSSIMKNVWLSFRSVGGKDYLRVKWCSNATVALSENADIILLDDSGETYTFNSCEFTVSGKGEGTVGFIGSEMYGLDIYTTGNCAAIKGKTLTDMRIHTTDGYIDFPLNKKSGKIIAKTYEVFDAEKKKTLTEKKKK